MVCLEAYEVMKQAALKLSVFLYVDSTAEDLLYCVPVFAKHLLVPPIFPHPCS